MATHSSILAWRIPWTEEPGGLVSMGSHRVESDLACMHACIGEGNGNPLQYSWRISGMEEPGGLLSMGSHRVGHDWGDLAAAATFLMVQLSHSYMTIGKIIALTLQTFVSKMMSLLFNILSRFVIAFHPRSKCLLILWLQSLSMVILEPKKINSVTVPTFSPSICHEVMGHHDLSFLNVEF